MYKEKTMKLGENPASDITGDEFLFSIPLENTDTVTTTTASETTEVVLDETSEEDVQLQAQGVTDVLKFLDKEVVDKIVELIKNIDVVQIKSVLQMLAGMVEMKPNGDVYLNLRVKVRDSGVEDIDFEDMPIEVSEKIKSN